MEKGTKTAHTDCSVGINRGERYWCASCGDIKAPCGHFPPIIRSASDLLESLRELMRALEPELNGPPKNVPKSAWAAQWEKAEKIIKGL